LRKTRLRFGNPANDLMRLTPSMFDSVGAELTALRRRQMRTQFDFYYMTLDLLLQPHPGATFNRVECQIDFGPKGTSEPIVQTMFPHAEWRDVLAWGGAFSLGLSGGLDWSAATSWADDGASGALPMHLKAKIANKNTFKGLVVVPEFRYTLGRGDIVATGEGNAECFWRIDKPALQKSQSVQLGVVFKVPRGMKAIDVTGLAAAEPDMNWLVADVRDVFRDLSDKLQRLLRLDDRERSLAQRLPVADHETWNLRLPRRKSQ
jgi:hypothetical protein